MYTDHDMYLFWALGAAALVSSLLALLFVPRAARSRRAGRQASARAAAAQPAGR